MRTELFPIPLYKYHVENNDYFVDFCQQRFDQYRFEMPSPFDYWFQPLQDIIIPYTDIIEQFMRDQGCYDTHIAYITGTTIRVLLPGESFDRTDTLPSQYTAVHYVTLDNNNSDIYHHPLRSIVRALDPGLKEWTTGAGLYVNAGDVVIYPSYLEHSSPANRSKDKRITLMFNFSLREKNEQSGASGTEEPHPQ
jgi:hypothetical protein